MKNLTAFRFPLLVLSAALACTAPLHAADPIETHWNDICKATVGNHLVLTMADGTMVEGYCVRVNADEIGVRTLDHQAVTIARSALSSLRLRTTEGHQLKSLGKGLHTGLRAELRWILSPRALEGLVALPVTLAWGAASAPFCMLGDLVAKLTPEREIKLLADSAPAPAHQTPLPTKSNP
jgi:hypothetical protein